MCSICKETLKGYMIVHAELDCPLRKSRYCSICAQYGHLTKSCPTTPSRNFTEPMYMEQLIAPSDLKRYRITSKTPLQPYEKEEVQALLQIKDNDKVFAAYLAARSIKVPSNSTKRETLIEYAKLENKRIILLK